MTRELRPLPFRRFQKIHRTNYPAFHKQMETLDDATRLKVIWLALLSFAPASFGIQILLVSFTWLLFGPEVLFWLIATINVALQSWTILFAVFSVRHMLLMRSLNYVFALGDSRYPAYVQAEAKRLEWNTRVDELNAFIELATYDAEIANAFRDRYAFETERYTEVKEEVEYVGRLAKNYGNLGDCQTKIPLTKRELIKEFTGKDRDYSGALSLARYEPKITKRDP